jgi:PIN domain nuclease of toxin-antitoxin system
MRILLDTCEFLWLVAGDAKLSPDVAALARNPQNAVFLSAVSFWEISLKHSLGKRVAPVRLCDCRVALRLASAQQTSCGDSYEIGAVILGGS